MNVKRRISSNVKKNSKSAACDTATNDKHHKQQLLCVFYAEFDNTIGPKVCFQSPSGFMDQCILSLEDSLHKCCDDQQISVTNGDPNDHLNHKKNDCNSFFDAISDYCITGPELADSILCVSTHGMQILMLPTIIHDKRYDRNSLLFSVGFVLLAQQSQKVDDDGAYLKYGETSYSSSRPYRPLLFKTVDCLRTVEIESQFLSDRDRRGRLQCILTEIRSSLNNRKNAEANLIIDEANSLNLKLFKSPKPLTPPVSDIAVPVLLRPEWQLQLYDWDLTINWIVQFIDGVKTTKAIAEESEVDLEMVRECLRVLKHHEVLTFVDIFQYSNHYESTPLASSMLNDRKSQLLDMALNFSLRKILDESTVTSGHNVHSCSEQKSNEGKSASTANRSDTNLSSSPQVASSPVLSSAQSQSMMESSSPKMANLSQNRNKGSTNESFSQRLRSLSEVRSLDEGFNELTHDLKRGSFTFKTALAQLYCCFRRDISLGSLIQSLIMRNEKKGSEKNRQSIEWKRILGMFDLRRLVTFGIIHGLIIRVHDFPLATIEGGESSLDKISDENLKDIVLAMDGTTRDDELCCRFQSPLSKLFEKATTIPSTKVNVMHMYSACTI